VKRRNPANKALSVGTVGGLADTVILPPICMADTVYGYSAHPYIQYYNNKIETINIKQCKLTI
jgi:hypothetical protein